MLDGGLALTEAGPHRRQGLTECKVSQNARSHRGPNIMNKGKVSQKAQEGRPHRNAGSHRLQGLTEGKAQHVKEGWVS